jgi:hypothetical protein
MSTFGTALIFVNICTALMMPFMVQFVVTVERDARRGVRSAIN